MNNPDLIFSAIAVAAGLVFVLLVLRHVWRTTRKRIVERRRERGRPDELATLRAERDRLRAAQAILRQQLEERIAAYRAQAVAFETEAVRLRNALGQSEESLAEAREDTERKAKEIARLNDIVANLEKDLETRTSELNKMRNRLRQREATLEELQQAHSVLERERNRLLHRLEEALSRQAALEKKLDARDAELATIKATASNMKPHAGREQKGQVVSLSEASMRKARSSAGIDDGDQQTQGLLGQVIALDRLAAALGRKAKGMAILAAEGRASDMQEEESTEVDVAHLKEELERLDALWKERLEALRKAADMRVSAQGKEN